MSTTNKTNAIKCIDNILSIKSTNELIKYLKTEKTLVLTNSKKILDDLYYNNSESEESPISDSQYDTLKDFLGKSEIKVQTAIGSKLRETDNATKLPFYMGSMDKIKHEDSKSLKNWLVKNNTEYYTIEDKLDGVSCLLVVGGAPPPKIGG